MTELSISVNIAPSYTHIHIEATAAEEVCYNHISGQHGYLQVL